MIVIAITAGRYIPDSHPKTILTPSDLQMRQFWQLWFNLSATHLANGYAIGGYRYIRFQVKRNGFSTLDYPVDTSIDGPWPAAGHRRNERMLRDSNPICLAAFPGNRGTEGCIGAAKRLEIPVFKWSTREGDFVYD